MQCATAEPAFEALIAKVLAESRRSEDVGELIVNWATQGKRISLTTHSRAPSQIQHSATSRTSTAYCNICLPSCAARSTAAVSRHHLRSRGPHKLALLSSTDSFARPTSSSSVSSAFAKTTLSLVVDTSSELSDLYIRKEIKYVQ